jgi:predicted O-methyltransferase YrrM
MSPGGADMMMTNRLSGMLRRLAWTNAATLRLATAAIDAAYAVRHLVGPRRQAVETVPECEAADLAPYRTYQRHYASTAGWFAEGAIVSWDALLAFQSERGQRGDLLEIGVLRGKSAAMLAVHAAPEEWVVLIDPALRQEAIDLVASAHPGHNLLLRARSQDVAAIAEVTARRGRCRWLHIDGEHSGRAVRNDLAIAAELMAPDGIICLDDFFAPAYPQITEAALRFLDDHRDELQLFLTGFRKAYVCARHAAPAYLQFVKDRLPEEYRRRGFTDFTLCKTTDPDDMNCFGLTPRRNDADFKGPDMDPARIEI